MKKIKICFVTHSTPEYLGGVSLFYRNLIEYYNLKKLNNIEITWVYFGKQDRKYTKDGTNYIEIKGSKAGPIHTIIENMKLTKVFKKNYFDIINYSGGFWTFFYKKKKNQRIIHIFHGTVYYFNKNHMKRIPLLLRPFFWLYLGLSYLVEIPHRKADKFICVSDKVSDQVKSLYGGHKNTVVIRTGVNLDNFRPRKKSDIRGILGLEKNLLYALYMGRGSYWTKGLDRAISLSEEMYKINNKFRLLVIGPDKDKVGSLLDKKFVIFIKAVPREKIPLYYSASDLFFCMSRYEGGAPTLVVSEAMASGCLLVCSKDSRQEIISDRKNGLIIDEFGVNDALMINKIYQNSDVRKKIIANSRMLVKGLSSQKWGEKYLAALLQ